MHDETGLAELRALHRHTALSDLGPERRPPLADRVRYPEVPPLRSSREPSVRAFSLNAPSPTTVVELVLRGYGVAAGTRQVPSAGGIYGLCVVAVSLQGGRLWKSDPGGRMEERIDTASAAEVSAALFGQLSGAPWVCFLLGDPHPYALRYSARGLRYLYLEAGHLAQELIGGAQQQGLSTCPLGAFDDEGVVELTGLRLTGHLPLYAVALGEAAP